MTNYVVEIYDHRSGETLRGVVQEDEYILDALEQQGIILPSACLAGACTTCAVKVRSGTIAQQEAVGLCRNLQENGYGLICIGYPRSDLYLETQREDEVYQLQFGQYFRQHKRSWFSFSWLHPD